MTVRILAPVESCCEPDIYALNTGQPHAICKQGREWVVVDAIDVGRGDRDWYAKWVIA